MPRGVLVLTLLLAACAGPDGASTTTTATVAPAENTSSSTTEAGASSTPPSVPEPTVITPPRTGEVPADLLERILDDARNRTGDDLEVIRDEAVTWSDGSLGCPEPDVMYPQVLVPGYWIVIDAGGTKLDYRAGQSGFFRLCESPSKLPPVPLDPET